MELSQIQLVILGYSDRETINPENVSDPALKLILRITESCLKTVRYKPSVYKHKQLDPNQIQKLCKNLLESPIDKQSADLFLSQLLSDGRFYSYLYSHFETITQSEEQYTILPENMAIQNNNDILAAVMRKMGKSSPKSRPALLPRVTPQFQFVFSALSRPIVRYAFVVSLLLIGVVVSPMIMRHHTRNQLYKKHFIHEKSAYVMAGQDLFGENPILIFRSSNQPSSERYHLQHQIQVFFDYYVHKYYKEALDQFDFDQSALSLLSEEQERLLQFYIGMSHLGIYRSARSDEHLDKAINHLKRAEEMSDKDNESILFFLALAFALIGDEQNVEALVNRIPEQSPFYQDAIKL